MHSKYQAAELPWQQQGMVGKKDIILSIYQNQINAKYKSSWMCKTHIPSVISRHRRALIG
jgi:hypothetical protein